MTKRARALLLAVGPAVLLSGCSATTETATNVSATSATLSARGSCGNAQNHSGNCFWYGQWGSGADYQHSSGPSFGSSGAAASILLSHHIRAGHLSPGTSYHYHVCVKRDGRTTFTCVRYDGTAKKSSSFTTGRQLYVAASGSRSSRCTSRSPCTFARADSHSRPGAVIHVAAGRYGRVSLHSSGTRAAPITWVSDSRWSAVMTANGGPRPIQILGVHGNYVRVQGFQVTGSGAGGTAGILMDGTGDEAISNYVHNVAIPCGSSRGGAGIALTGYNSSRPTASNQEATANYVRDIGDQRDQPLGSCSVHTIQGIYPSVPRDAVADNVVVRAAANGISPGHFSSSNIVVNNLVDDNGENGIDISPGSNGSYVADNIAEHNRNAGITDCCASDPPQGVTYKDNLMRGNGSNRIDLDDPHPIVSGTAYEK